MIFTAIANGFSAYFEFSKEANKYILDFYKFHNLRLVHSKYKKNTPYFYHPVLSY